MILYQDFDSPVGPMIGGATDRGICFLEWHDRGGWCRPGVVGSSVANRSVQRDRRRP